MSNKSPSQSEIPSPWRPHLYYVGACLAFKLVFQSLLNSVATRSVSLVNFWYPLIATVACVHELRHPNTASKKAKEARQVIDHTISASRSVDDEDDSDKDLRMVDGEKKKASSNCHYWLQYWTIYALAQTLDQVLLLVASLLFRNHLRQRNQLMAELNLFFSIYLFLMKTPVSVCYHWAKPHIIRGHLAISEAISEESWTILFASKFEQLLELMVTVHLLAQPMKDQAVVVLRESRTLIVPATLTLLPLTPSFFTRLGVVYSQYCLPVGKATSQSSVNSELRQLHYLKYWILHSCVSIFFEALSLFWWMPFYHHGMFLFWSYLSFDSTISEYYNVLELDLISLGILPGDSKVEVHETQTVQFLTAIAKRLPSADEATFKGIMEEGEANLAKRGSSTLGHSSDPPAAATEDRQAVAQLKSLIRQLPKDENLKNMDDDKTTQILEMLIHQLKKEEEKVLLCSTNEVVLVEGGLKNKESTTAIEEPCQDSHIIPSDDTEDQWIDIIADELVSEMSITTEGKSYCTTSVTSDDDDDEIFFETERDLSEEGQLSSPPRQQQSIGREPEGKLEHAESAESTVAEDKESSSKSEDFYDAEMPERRSKRERNVGLSKENSSSSFVSKLMVRMESNQRAKRKGKREKLKEKKKKDKLKKLS